MPSLRRLIPRGGVRRALVLAGTFAIATGWIWPDGKAYNAGLAATVGTALGTAILALATYGLATTTSALAKTTGDDVRASQRIAEMTAEDQELRDRPEIRVLPGAQSSDAFSLGIQNVGNAPARDVRIYFGGDLAAGGAVLGDFSLVPVDTSLVPVHGIDVRWKDIGMTPRPLAEATWDVTYLNRWRSWSYEQVEGRPVRRQRVRFLTLDDPDSRLDDARLA
jgi:hypothetical protein